MIKEDPVKEVIDQLNKPIRRALRWGTGAAILMSLGMLSMKYDMYRATHDLKHETTRATAAADSASSAARYLRDHKFIVIGTQCYTRDNGLYKVTPC